MPECELSSPGQCQSRKVSHPARDRIAIGQIHTKGKIWHQMIEWFMSNMHRLKAAQAETNCRQRGSGVADRQSASIEVRRRRECDPMNPHRQSEGSRDIPESVEQPVQRIVGRDMTLCDQGNSQAEAIAPEWKPAVRKGS